MVAASNSTIEGLAIDSFSGSGIVISGTSGDLVAADVIGLTVPGKLGGTPGGTSSGTGPLAGNGGEGVLILGGANNNTIGGTTPGDATSSEQRRLRRLPDEYGDVRQLGRGGLHRYRRQRHPRPTQPHQRPGHRERRLGKHGRRHGRSGDVISGNTYNGLSSPSPGRRTTSSRATSSRPMPSAPPRSPTAPTASSSRAAPPATRLEGQPSQRAT